MGVLSLQKARERKLAQENGSEVSLDVALAASGMPVWLYEIFDHMAQYVSEHTPIEDRPVDPTHAFNIHCKVRTTEAPRSLWTITDHDDQILMAFYLAADLESLNPFDSSAADSNATKCEWEVVLKWYNDLLKEHPVEDDKYHLEHLAGVLFLHAMQRYEYIDTARICRQRDKMRVTMILQSKIATHANRVLDFIVFFKPLSEQDEFE